MAAALELLDVAYSYPDGGRALDGVSLTIEQGERVALLGANGAGKSTLMLHLNGLLVPARGEVRVFGTRVERTSFKQVRRDVGLLFQNPDDQLFCPTVFDDVAFGPRNLGLGEAEVGERVARALEQVRLSGFANRSVWHLSLGEKKRAALATVLAMDARLLAFDEPTNSLDPRGRREFLALVREIGRTQLVVTHDLELARDLCTRAVVMAFGRVIAEGPVERILDDTALLDRHGLR
jgi:cobalt/nickel transport system ATP-binding protein